MSSTMSLNEVFSSTATTPVVMTSLTVCMNFSSATGVVCKARLRHARTARQWPRSRRRRDLRTRPGPSAGRFVQNAVAAVTVEQLVVGAALDHSSVVEDDDLIDVFQAFQVMSDQQRGTAAGGGEQVRGERAPCVRIQV